MSGSSSGRFELLGRTPAFRALALARLGSGAGTYLAAVALQVDVFARTGSAVWISALLVVEFVPGILVGLLLGPLLDRWPRRAMMISSDLVNIAVFVALGFASSASEIVVLAFCSGFANGFFRPVVYAAMPNLVAEGDLEVASSLLQTVEYLTMTAGPPLGGLLVVARGTHASYWLNAATFAGSALLVARIPRTRLHSEQAVSRGHWRDLAAGFSIVRRSPALSAVLLTWPIVSFAGASINVAEIVIAKRVFDAGNVGFGVLSGVSGLGLATGSLLAGGVTRRFSVARVYPSGLALTGIGFLAAALMPNLWSALPLVALGAAGNGTCVVCNFVLIGRGAPDELRGRAVTLLMSVGSVAMLLGMVVSGRLTETAGARWVWAGSGLVVLAGAFVGRVRVTRLPQ